MHVNPVNLQLETDCDNMIAAETRKIKQLDADKVKLQQQLARIDEQLLEMINKVQAIGVAQFLC